MLQPEVSAEPGLAPRVGLAIGAVSALALLLAPAGAVAGTASIVEDYDERAGQTYQTVRYTAGAGERNHLTVAAGQDRVTLADSAGIATGPGCSRPDPGDSTTAVCTYASPDQVGGPVDVELADGDDRASVTGWRAELDGGPGQDLLTAEAGAGMTGGRGDDDLRGGPGEDLFYEGAASSGSDTIRGGEGRDQVLYSERRRGVRVDLDEERDDGEPGEGDLVGADVEHLFGGVGDDRLIGSAANNFLRGDRGSDVLRGGAGDDTLEGQINATGGRRTRDREHLDGGEGDDYLIAGDGAALVIGGAGQDQLTGGSGDNAIRATDGDGDAVDCLGGRDAVSVDELDHVSARYGRCERIRRRGPAAAVLSSVGAQFVNTVVESLGRSIELHVGCPADGPPRCAGRLELFLDGARLSRLRLAPAAGVRAVWCSRSRPPCGTVSGASAA